MPNNKNQILRFDWAMRKILRLKTNFPILEGLLTSLFKEKITIIRILTSRCDDEDVHDKLNRIDLLAQRQNGDVVIIELQNISEYVYYQRTIFETSKLITSYINQGCSLTEVKKIYCINIVFFDLGHGEDYLYTGKTELKGIHTQETLRIKPFIRQHYLVDTGHRLFPEFYILKAYNFTHTLSKPLDEWMYYLSSCHIPHTVTEPGLIQARELLDLDKMSKEELANYDRYLNNIVILRDNIYTAREEGRAEGLKEGIAKELEETNRSHARTMKTLGIPAETISQVTGLSKKEIEEL